MKVILIIWYLGAFSQFKNVYTLEYTLGDYFANLPCIVTTKHNFL